MILHLCQPLTQQAVCSSATRGSKITSSVDVAMGQWIEVSFSFESAMMITHVDRILTAHSHGDVDEERQRPVVHRLHPPFWRCSSCPDHLAWYQCSVKDRATHNRLTGATVKVKQPLSRGQLMSKGWAAVVVCACAQSFQWAGPRKPHCARRLQVFDACRVLDR